MKDLDHDCLLHSIKWKELLLCHSIAKNSALYQGTHIKASEEMVLIKNQM